MSRFTNQRVGQPGPQPGDDMDVVMVVGPDGKSPGSSPSSYALLTNASATGTAQTGVRGGDYIWRVEGTWGGATATLQYLGLDGTTWKNVRNQAGTADVTATADTQMGVGIGQGATVRVAVTGATAGTTSLNSVLSGLS